ncbi:MAG: carboxypeptidase regulatory-like domain-containing protein, partial [Actinobacteria bacterium]|nr:carboxypeptidase regulatory-like domain-containing protein [Actinomycetota bacterium]
DFWFEDLEEGTYSLTIEADGFASVNYDSLDTSTDVNLGEIGLGH